MKYNIIHIRGPDQSVMQLRYIYNVLKLSNRYWKPRPGILDYMNIQRPVRIYRCRRIQDKLHPFVVTFCRGLPKVILKPISTTKVVYFCFEISNYIQNAVLIQDWNDSVDLRSKKINTEYKSHLQLTRTLKKKNLKRNIDIKLSAVSKHWSKVFLNTTVTPSFASCSECCCKHLNCNKAYKKKLMGFVCLGNLNIKWQLW